MWVAAQRMLQELLDHSPRTTSPIQKTLQLCTLPGDETQDYECRHEYKGTDQVWYFNDNVCGFETQIATESVHNTITCEKNTLTHTEDSSTVSPGDETQDYECRHENKGTDQVWYFNDDVCGLWI